MKRSEKRSGRFPHEMDKFGEQRIIIEMSGFELMRSDESIFRNSYSMLNLNQLNKAVDSLQYGLRSAQQAILQYGYQEQLFQDELKEYNEFQQAGLFQPGTAAACTFIQFKCPHPR